jgi:putative Mn2+ efflux pump MntP
MELGHILFLLALLVPLTMDTFVISAALGIAGLPKKDQLRTSLVFTVFEAGMPAVGLLIGKGIGDFLGDYASYIAALVIATAGALMLRPGSDENQEERQTKLRNRANGFGVISLGFAISIDEIAIGLSLGLIGVPLLLAVVLIGAQAFLASQLGLKLGAKLSEKAREGTEKIAGLALIATALILVALKIFGHQI